MNKKMRKLMEQAKQDKKEHKHNHKIHTIKEIMHNTTNLRKDKEIKDKIWLICLKSIYYNTIIEYYRLKNIVKKE